MPRPRLLTKHGEIVPQWIVSSDELRRLMTMEPKPRPLQKVKRARLTVPKNKLALWPEVIGTRELLKPEVLLGRIYCPLRYRVWNWVEDRAIPPQLSAPADLAEWGVTRGASTHQGAAFNPPSMAMFATS